MSDEYIFSNGCLYHKMTEEDFDALSKTENNFVEAARIVWALKVIAEVLEFGLDNNGLFIISDKVISCYGEGKTPCIALENYAIDAVEHFKLMREFAYPRGL